MIDALHRTVHIIATAVLSASIITVILLTSGASAASLSPSIVDSLPLEMHRAENAMADSFNYNVPAGGTNKLFIAFVAKSACEAPAPAMSLNGVALTVTKIPGPFNRACYYIGYLAEPTSGAFNINFSNSTEADYTVFTLQDAAQVNPIDVAAVTFEGQQTSNSTSVTTTVGNTLLLSLPKWETATFSSFGPDESAFLNATTSSMAWTAGSYKIAANTPGIETMTINISSAREVDEPVVAIKPASVPLKYACMTPNIAPAGYTIQDGLPGNDSVNLTPFTMFVGNGGNDTVLAKNGDVIVCLGDGNDTVTLGKGFAVVAAGEGKNKVLTGNGNKVVTSGSGDDETVTGSGDDEINAGGGKNKVITRGGNDEITTLDGDDFIDGGAGADICTPGGGVNTVLNC